MTQAYTMPIDLQAIKQELAKSDRPKQIPIGSLDFGQSNQTLHDIRENGAQVLYAASSIEWQMDEIISNYVFPGEMGRNDRRDFFVQNILKTSAFTYAFRKQIVEKLINDHDLLEGKDKNHLVSGLKQIMSCRNAFAHGRIEYDSKKGGVLNYYEGSPEHRFLTTSTGQWSKNSSNGLIHYLMTLLETYKRGGSPIERNSPRGHNKSLNATPKLCMQLSPGSEVTVMADRRLGAR